MDTFNNRIIKDLFVTQNFTTLVTEEVITIIFR